MAGMMVVALAMVVLTPQVFAVCADGDKECQNLDQSVLLQKHVSMAMEQEEAEPEGEGEQEEKEQQKDTDPALVEHKTTMKVDLATTKIIAGVPVYNYHHANPEGGMSPSALELSQPKTWLIDFPDTYTSAKINEFCTNCPGNSNCTYKSDPDSGGIELAVFQGTEAELKEVLMKHPDITPNFVEPDSPSSAIPEVPDSENDAFLIEQAEAEGRSVPWGLDRIDDMSGLDGSYNTPSGGKQGDGAHVYVADTGIRISHDDFGGRASAAIEVLGGSTTVKECSMASGACAEDNHGHGTHCAGTVGGTTYGVAKKTKLYAVKVLSDRGSGYSSDIIKSVDWVATKGNKPAIWSASLGGSGSSHSYEAAFSKAMTNGVTISVAAGNSNDNACHYSPAGAASAITVGATDTTDKRTGFSNYGSCVDIFAPGRSIKSAGKSSDSATATKSGTSMACPHVSGVAALYLADTPGLAPEHLWWMMKAAARMDIVSDVKGSPNYMLYTGGSSIPTNPPTLAPTIPPTAYCGFESRSKPYCGIWRDSNSDTFQWSHRSGKTPSQSTGPSSAKQGSYYLYIETSHPRKEGDDAKLEACGLMLGPGAKITFDYHMYGSTIGKLQIYDDNIKKWEESGSKGNGWISQSVDLSGSGCVSFVGVAGSSWTGDIAIDNVAIHRGVSTTLAPTQPPPATTSTPPQPPSTSVPTAPPTQPPAPAPGKTVEEKLNAVWSKLENIENMLTKLTR